VNILSIHSSVALGFVGNRGVTFALQRLGHTVWPVDTVVLSNHPAHGGARGRAVPAAEMSELLEGLRERGVLGTCDAVLTGYLGDAAQADMIIDAVTAVRTANPGARWLLDPIIGDHGRVYVKPGIPEFLRDRAAPLANILTPNAFELAVLAGQPCETMAEALAAIDVLRARSQRAPLVVATGLRLGGRASGTLTTIAADATGGWSVEVPTLERTAHGAGDVFAAVLLARLLDGGAVASALERAAAAVHGVLDQTPASDLDLALIAAQNEMTNPRQSFHAQRVR
jgi:pyridoxine kinase